MSKKNESMAKFNDKHLEEPIRVTDELTVPAAKTVARFAKDDAEKKMFMNILGLSEVVA